MNWFQQQRQVWIAESASIYGYINLHHIEKKFGISRPAAALDIRMFLRLNPGKLVYDKNQKAYLWHTDTIPTAQTALRSS